MGNASAFYYFFVWTSFDKIRGYCVLKYEIKTKNGGLRC